MGKEKLQTKTARTYQIIISKKEGDKYFKQHCLNTNNLYNLTNYYIRHSYFYGLEKDDSKLDADIIDTVSYINSKIDTYNQNRVDNGKKEINNLSKEYYPMYNYYFLDYMIKNLESDRLLNTNPYRELPSAVAQSTLKTISEQWKGYFKSLQEWRKNPNKFTGKPKMPKYKKKDKLSYLYFGKNGFSIKDDYIVIASRLIGYKLKNPRPDLDVLQIRILPKHDNYIVEIVFEVEIEEQYLSKLNDSEKNRCIGVDLGVNNLMAVTNNFKEKPFLINGKHIKSINQFYNKEKAKAMSYIGDRGISHRTAKLDLKRKNLISDKIHKASKYLIDYCEEYNVDAVVIGHNNGWKQNVDIGKVNNQNFVNIPFSDLINQIEYKGNAKGIKVIQIDEKYTSKSSFLDSDILPKEFGNYKFSGKREKRGLYKSRNGNVINADINGSLNILRKVVGDNLIHNVCDDLTPMRITLK